MVKTGKSKLGRRCKRYIVDVKSETFPKGEKAPKYCETALPALKGSKADIKKGKKEAVAGSGTAPLTHINARKPGTAKKESVRAEMDRLGGAPEKETQKKEKKKKKKKKQPVKYCFAKKMTR